MSAASCTGGTVSDGGLPGFDGGFPFCDVDDPNACPGNECCDGFSGFPIGTCVSNGAVCQYAPTPFLGGVCNGSVKACQ